MAVRLIRNLSLKRLMVFFFIISVMLMLILTVFFYTLYRQNARINAEQSLKLYIDEQIRQFDDALISIRTSLHTFAEKQEISDYLARDYGYKATNVQYVKSFITDITSFVTYIDDILLTSTDGRMSLFSYNKSDMHNFLVRYEMLEEYRREEVIGTWLNTAPCARPDQFILVAAVPVYPSNIPVQAGTAIGFVFSFSSAQKILNSFSFSERPFAVFRDDELMYSNVSGAAEKPDALPREWSHFFIRSLDWNVYFEPPLSIRENALSGSVLRWGIIMGALFVLIEFVLILMIYGTIIEPISSISLQSTRINSTASLIDNPAPKRFELSNLVDNINAMVVRTNLLTEKVHDADIRLMKMENLHLKEKNMFLQAQINPHFLYNMLECICGMASEEGIAQVREMTRLLSRMYRYCLKSPESTLGEELECLALYREIIRRRYRENYLFEQDIPEDLHLLPLPRMVLEPLVENAVQHGFVHGTGQTYAVRIWARMQENTLEIRIEDNGCGMNAEKLKELNEKLSSTAPETENGEHHIGILNVGMRLRLIYGGKSGLRLEENDLGGLTIRMLIRYPIEDIE